MKRKLQLQSANQGFSLVELLVVIAVIAIIAAIAIPNIANITSQATVAKNQRNAQNIASVASAARAAGYTNSWGSQQGAVDTLTQSNGQGITVTVGNNNSLQFGVSGLSPAEGSNAVQYLNYQPAANGVPDGILYSGTAVTTTPSGT